MGGLGSGNDPRWFKQAQRGLYAGKQRLTGNHVSASKRRVRRSWMPNVQRAHLWSDVFDKRVSINVTTAALRQMDRMGGFDEYILRTPEGKLHSALGERIRAQMHKKMRGEEAAGRKEAVGKIRAAYAAATPEQKRVIEDTLRAKMGVPAPSPSPSGEGAGPAGSATAPAGPGQQMR